MEMKIDGEHSFHTVYVTLSRRNLKALLAKLDGHPKDSACSLIRVTDSGNLIVKAIEDEEAYPDRLPGLMHPETEARIK